MADSPNPLALITGGGGDLAVAIEGELNRAGFDVLAPPRTALDVRSPSAVESYFENHVTRPLALLVNNAGIRRDAALAKLTADDLNDVIDTNLKGAFLCSQQAIKQMLRSRAGHIVNIGSYSALSGPHGQTAYAAAKAGLIGLTKSLALEGGRRNVRSNCILPGFLETKFTADLSDRVRDRALQDHALGSFNTVEDAARFVAFLDSMSHVSGQVFQLDSRVRRWS